MNRFHEKYVKTITLIANGELGEGGYFFQRDLEDKLGATHKNHLVKEVLAVLRREGVIGDQSRRGMQIHYGSGRRERTYLYLIMGAMHDETGAYTKQEREKQCIFWLDEYKKHHGDSVSYYSFENMIADRFGGES